MRVWVTVPEGARAPLDKVFPSDTIANVKQLITIRFWLAGKGPGSPFSLYYKCLKLDDNRTLKEYNIVDGMCIVIKADGEYTFAD